MPVGTGLLERQDVLAAIERLITGLAAGSSGTLFVLGDPGHGKTSVLDHARSLAKDAGLASGFGRGHPMETALPFGLAMQALEGAGGFGLADPDESASGSPGGWAARFYRVLRWLQDRPGGGLLLVFDDLHWADADSLALISFLGRRAGSVRLGLIGSLRPWPPEASDAVSALVQEGHDPIHRLAALTEPAAATLLESWLGQPMPDETRQRAYALSAGNPLLIEQLSVAIGRGEKLPDAATAGRGTGTGMLLARFAGLPAAGMRCAQAASVLGTSFLPEVAAEMAGLGGADVDTAVESLGRAGLIRQETGAAAEFVHPLFRQALYDDLPGPRRVRLHGKAFASLHARGLDDQAAEHCVRAGLAGDAEAVAVLERVGRAARRAGAFAAAVSRLNAAADLAGDRASVGLLLARAEALLVSGRADQAVAAYELLLARPACTPAERAEALWMLGRAVAMTGAHDRAAATFEEAARTAQGGDPATAVRVLLDASFAALITQGPKGALGPASRARELARSLDTDLRVSADAVWGEMAVQAGDPAGIAAAEVAAPWLRARQAPGDGRGPNAFDANWGSVNRFAFTAVLTERLPEAEQAFAVLRAEADRAMVPDAGAVLAIGHGFALTRMGRLDAALDAIKAATALAELAPLVESFAAVGAAYIQLYRGDLDDSARWCDQVAARASARGEWNALLFLWDVLGHRLLCEGAPDAACELYGQLEDMVARMGIGEPCLPPWGRHAVSAYLAAGRTADAERVIGWLERAAGRLPCRFPRIAAAAGRAQLADRGGHQDQADAHYKAALALHAETDLPLEHAETLIGYGAYLRRSGQPTAARKVLGQARQIAAAAGAGWLATHAAEELRVAGGRRGRGRSPLLSAQEERVASLAAAGATNADIARQLSLSVKTVETHLEHIYAKLGVHSRYELIAMAPRVGWTRSD